MSPRVLVPRPVGRAEGLLSALAAQGLNGEHHPFLELVPEHDGDLREAVEDLAAGAFSWLVLTSPAAITALAALGEGPAAAPDVPPSTRIAVVGDGTAEALRAAGQEPALIASGSGEALVREMPDPESGEETVLFAASSAAAPTVPDGLAQRGYRVRREIAYRPRAASVDPQAVRDLLHGRFAAILLTSSMIARMAASLPIHLSTQVVTIGAPTTSAAHAAGLRVDAEADRPDDAALARAARTAIDTATDTAKES